MNLHMILRLSFLAWTVAAGTLVHGDPITITKLSPQRKAQRICTDTPLYITFNQPPVLGTAGSIRVYSSDNTLFDTIDLADPNSKKRSVGGAPFTYNYYPVIVTGNTAAIYLHHTLAYGETYYILMDPGVFSDPDGDPFPGIQHPHRWRFSTKAAAPPIDAMELTVSADGKGEFCTVQGAIDAVPDPNTQPVTIYVHKGTYTETVYVKSTKPFITVRGEDRNDTVIQYADNQNLNPNSNARMLFGVDAADFTLEDLTMHNTTPYGGSQAEAFRGNAYRILLNRVNLKSFQDTLLLQVQGFVTNSYIEGDVDFMWGYGQAFFQNCELKALHAGYYTQIRNPYPNTNLTHGNVYVNCVLDRTPAFADNTVYLGRIDPTAFPLSQVVWINSAMDSHIMPIGWLLNTRPSANDCSQAPNIQFWEYHSTDLKGNPIDVSQRLSCSNQLTDEQAALWSDPSFVLGGWVPRTVNANIDAVHASDPITVNWSTSPWHVNDWIGLYNLGAPDTDYLAIQPVGASTTGTLVFTAPTWRGRYQFRYFLGNGFQKVAESGIVVVR